MPVPLSELEQHQARKIGEKVKESEQKKRLSIKERFNRGVDNIITPIHPKVKVEGKKDKNG